MALKKSGLGKIHERWFLLEFVLNNNEPSREGEF